MEIMKPDVKEEEEGEEEASKQLSVNELTCSPLGFLWRLYGSSL